jgi:four helix bundle protein
MQEFRNLTVWQRAHELTLAVYSATQAFPKAEAFGLTSQLRRCSSSVPSLIAEGCGRGSDEDFARFLQMAMGSASEAEYQLLLSKDLGYLDPETHVRLEGLTIEVKKMLAAFLSKLRPRAKSNGRAPLTAES